MDQSLFYVYHAGQQAGPFSLEQIAAKVQSNELMLNDYLYEERISDWTVIAAFTPLASTAAPTPVSAPAPVVVPQAPDEWFALKGDLRFGPFAYTEIVRLLQDKSMQDSDFVWHAGMSKWQKVAELAEFSVDAIRKLRDAGLPGMNEVFFRRRHARVQHGCSIIMHNNQKVFRGKGIEISAGGAGIMVDARESKNLDIGHQVFLHFKPDEGLPPFNAVCEVVSRRIVNSTDATAPIHYGVKFLKVDEKTTEAIEALASAARAA